jgi:glycosyltransferase involved in cell wall biosynthesis
MNVLVISLRYAPGNWQHMMSFSSQLKKRDIKVNFVLAKEFKPFVKDENLNKVFYCGYSKGYKSLVNYFCNIFRLFFLAKDLAVKNDKALFVIWNPLNFYFMFLLKAFNKRIEITLWLHEPYKENKEKYGDKKYYFYLSEFFQKLSYKYVDNFVFHSIYALRLFNKYIKSHIKGKAFNTYVIPLQFRNIVSDSIDRYKREYFTYIGNIAYAKGFDIFLDIVKNSKNFKFNITTSAFLEGSIPALENLFIVYKKILTDIEIADSLCKSIATICLYRDSTQSGVIPFSFMCGTPVLVSNIDAFKEYLSNKYNCIVINDINNFDEIKAGMNYIDKHFKRMSNNCFDTFNQYFNDVNFDKYYSWFINENK